MAKGNPNRQKMINMMYLVLTALLALNVSKQVLKAFELVNNGLEGTNKNFAIKNDDTYKVFDKQMELNPAKTKPWHDKALAAKAEADAMYKHIETMKTTLVERGQGYEHPEIKADLRMQDNMDVGHLYFIQEGNGEKLRKRLEEFKTKMSDFSKDAKGQVTVKPSIDTEAKKKVKEAGEEVTRDWTDYYFAELPLISNLTMLIKTQNEIRNAEAEVVKSLLANIDATSFKFDNLQAIISSEKPLLLAGQKYEAKIVLGAYDSKQSPTITVNGSPIKVEDGVGKYETTASGEGNKDVKGEILVKSPDGELKKYPFSTAYQVFTGSAVISADKMNVVYIGLENPISISVPGFAPDKILASCTGGDMTGSRGSYILKPKDDKAINKCVINVSVQMGDKSVKQMGAKEYRIKQVPKPVIKFGSIEGGKQPKIQLSVQKSILAVLDGFVFDGVKYTVQEYEWTYAKKGGKFYNNSVKGNAIAGELQGYIQAGMQGDLVLISGIRVIGPDGKSRTIGSGPTITIQ